MSGGRFGASNPALTREKETSYGGVGSERNCAHEQAPRRSPTLLPILKFTSDKLQQIEGV